MDFTSVPDPDLKFFGHLDPLVRGMDPDYGSRSGSNHHQAKLVRKTLISTVLFVMSL
jgi:hypothetical protein